MAPTMRDANALVRLFLAGMAMALTLSACASGARSDFGLGDRQGAFPVGFPNVRFSIEDEDAVRRITQQLAQGVPHGPDGRFDLIALSGGGANGAYTAGLMNGWTARGDRPDFEVVTGVSTGALAAPFVFLGPAYDGQLRNAYTSGEAAGLLKSRGARALIGSGVFSGQPLRNLIATHIDQSLLQAVAAEHSKGRMLIVATTDLDSERAVLWNLGAIAERGGPDALALFRDVLAASASIPGAFPPVMIQSQNTASGPDSPLTFEEMHVDGGVMSPFVALPQMMWSWRDAGEVLRGGRIWVIVNGKAAPTFRVTRDAAPTVLSRSLDAALLANLRANLAANQVFAQRNGMEYRTTAIPVEFDGANSLNFSVEAMMGVYELGHRRMVEGQAWTLGRATPEERPIDELVAITQAQEAAKTEAERTTVEDTSATPR